MKDVLKQWTVWEFRGVTVPQDPVVAVRVSEVFESEHEYQKILGRVEASSRREAQEKAALIAEGRP